jgi:hypothetical protein
VWRSKSASDLPQVDNLVLPEDPLQRDRGAGSICSKRLQLRLQTRSMRNSCFEISDLPTSNCQFSPVCVANTTIADPSANSLQRDTGKPLRPTPPLSRCYMLTRARRREIVYASSTVIRMVLLEVISCSPLGTNYGLGQASPITWSS